MQKFRLLSLLILSGALYAQTTASTGTPGSIQGRVVDAQSGDGIAAASLHLFPRGLGAKAGVRPVTAVSLDDGNFRFDSVTPATYVLFATHANYANGSGAMQTVLVGDGSQVQGVTVSLSPLGSLSGKVFAGSGRPAAGARVSLFMVSSRRGRMQLRRAQNATAGEDGAYLFKKVYPGKYYVAADPVREADVKPEKQGPANDSPSPPLEAVRSFYPKASNLESASAIELAAGASVGDADIHMQRAEVFNLSGKIASLLPSGVQKGASLEITPRDMPPGGGLGRRVQSQADGSFAVGGVESGSYTLWLMGSFGGGAEQNRRMGRRRVLARQDVDVNGGNVDGVELALMPTVNLTGQVTFLNAAVSANNSQLQLYLQPAGQVAIGSFQVVKVDSSGAFAVNDLDPGEYMVRVANVPNGMYVQSITFNRQDVRTSGIDVSESGGGELDVTLKTGVGEVDGTLQAPGSSDAASGTALLIPEIPAADGSGVFMGTAGAGGTFTIKNVPPGHYFGYAVEQWTSIWQNVDFLRAMQRDGKSIDLQENGHAQVDLPLLGADQVEQTAARLGLSVE